MISELTRLLRHYHDTRFKHLTLFLVVNGLLVNVVVDRTIEHNTGILLRVFGLVTTVVFYSLEKRATAYWYSFRDKIQEAERGEHVEIFGDIPSGIFLRPRGPSALVTEIFYLLVGAFWIASFSLVPY